MGRGAARRCASGGLRGGEDDGERMVTKVEVVGGDVALVGAPEDGDGGVKDGVGDADDEGWW